jgi:hypothetical protein
LALATDYSDTIHNQWLLNIQAGLVYDSNISIRPDTNDISSGTASNDGGGRWVFGGEAEYLFVQKDQSDFSAKLAIANTQSFSTDFAEGDPLTVTSTLPYNKFGVLRDKPFHFRFTPGHEAIYLDYDRSGRQTNILSSFTANVDLSLTMSNNWLSGYALEIRLDEYLIAGTDETDNDSDALKSTLKKSEIYFLDESKTRNVTGYLGYTMNAAEGDEKYFTRFELGATYNTSLSVFKNSYLSTGITLYSQDYGKSSDNETDRYVSYLLGFNKMQSKQWRWGVNASTAQNASTDDTNDYDKYVIATNISYSWGR